MVTLFSREHGKFAALARGARRSARRFAGGLGIGVLGEARLNERQSSDLALLESLDVTQDFGGGMAGDIGKTAHLAYALELVEKLNGARHAEPAVFDLILQFMRLLLSGSASAERVRGFELRLLHALGIGVVLETCALCGRDDIDVAEMVRWVPTSGGVVCVACAREGTALFPAARQALLALAIGDLGQVEAVSLPAEVQSACRQAIFAVLSGHLSGPLRSLEFIEKMRAAHNPR